MSDRLNPAQDLTPECTASSSPLDGAGIGVVTSFLDVSWRHSGWGWVGQRREVVRPGRVKRKHSQHGPLPENVATPAPNIGTGYTGYTALHRLYSPSDTSITIWVFLRETMSTSATCYVLPITQLCFPKSELLTIITLLLNNNFWLVFENKFVSVCKGARMIRAGMAIIHTASETRGMG